MFKLIVNGLPDPNHSDAEVVARAWHLGKRRAHTKITKNGNVVFEMKSGNIKIDKLKPEWQCGVRVK